MNETIQTGAIVTIKAKKRSGVSILLANQAGKQDAGQKFHRWNATRKLEAYATGTLPQAGSLRHWNATASWKLTPLDRLGIVSIDDRFEHAQ